MKVPAGNTDGDNDKGGSRKLVMTPVMTLASSYRHISDILHHIVDQVRGNLTVAEDAEFVVKRLGPTIAYHLSFPLEFPELSYFQPAPLFRDGTNGHT